MAVLKLEIHDGDTLADLEKEIILLVLEKNNGNRAKTARDLEIGIRTLQRKLGLYGVPKGVSGSTGNLHESGYFDGE